MENELIGYVVAVVAVLGFAFFIYKKVTAKKPPSSGTGAGGGGRPGPGGNVNEN